MSSSRPIRTPTERRCERCGREESWDETIESWVIFGSNGESAVGEVHCLHEWDITGSFSPYE